MKLSQIIFIYISVYILKETSCATTPTTSKTTTAKTTATTLLATTSSSSSGGNLEWLPYVMGVVFALIGIFLIAVVSYTIYVKFFKFSELPRKEQPTQVTTQIAVKTIEEPEQEIMVTNEQTATLQGSESRLIDKNNRKLSSKEEETLESPKQLEKNDSFHLPKIFTVRQSEPVLNEVETESIKSVSTFVSEVPKKTDFEPTVQSANPVPIDYTIFSTRIAPLSISNDKTKEDNNDKELPSIHLPLPSKIYPINKERTVIKKRKRTSSPKEVEVTSNFVRSANKLWYSIDPQIDNNEFREIKNNRKFAIYAYNPADDQSKQSVFSYSTSARK